MGQVPIEDYIKMIQKSDPAYQWPLENIEKKKTKRQEIHEKFPYVVTYCGHYGHGSLLDDLSDWCRDKFGDCDGECHWRGCELDWDKWHQESGLEDILMKALNDERENHPKPDEKDKKAMKKWEKEDNARDIIGEHFEMIKTRTDAPEEHSHEGIWTSHFVMKTGYDYGYEDYCFKNEEDAFYFKLINDEEAERRG